MDGTSLGRIGIWRRHQEGTEGVEEIEALGFGALWLGGSPFLERSNRLPIATGILNVWRHDPAEVAADHGRLNDEFGGRFLLGVGIGHPEATREYRRPIATMGAVVDGLQAAERPVPRDELVLAALGPRMLDLAGGGSDGLIDAVVPHGSAEQVAEAVHAHLDAGADHVCRQPVGNRGMLLEDYHALARVLIRSS